MHLRAGSLNTASGHRSSKRWSSWSSWGGWSSQGSDRGTGKETGGETVEHGRQRKDVILKIALQRKNANNGLHPYELTAVECQNLDFFNCEKQTDSH